MAKFTHTHTDPSQNFLELPPHPLDSIFKPQSVAIIGAKSAERSVGRTLLANLLHPSFKGKVYPVNPKHETLLGQRCYPDIGSIPDAVDLAIIATPAKTVPSVIAQCVEAKVKSAIII